ncbi:hypothetical protein AVEN_274192-1 [Araneus ventricosus]|uniref:Uncharacterized protein n=1 Tax=Araneus ventricosus TaxID=182803 RepID=A0A4Y2R5Q0_ARAVE|nr:hypothetical protein AVEN_274192-1 [Araneus ventricosus]
MEPHQLILIVSPDVLVANQTLSDTKVKKKRKFLFSSPLQPKISRNNWNEEQHQEEHLSVNGTSLQISREVPSNFSISPPASQMMLADPLDISSQSYK